MADLLTKVKPLRDHVRRIRMNWNEMGLMQARSTTGSVDTHKTSMSASKEHSYTRAHERWVKQTR